MARVHSLLKRPWKLWCSNIIELLIRRYFLQVNWRNGWAGETEHFQTKKIQKNRSQTLQKKYDDWTDAEFPLWETMDPPLETVADPGRPRGAWPPSALWKWVIKKMAVEGIRIDFMFLGPLPLTQPLNPLLGKVVLTCDMGRIVIFLPAPILLPSHTPPHP